MSAHSLFGIIESLYYVSFVLLLALLVRIFTGYNGNSRSTRPRRNAFILLGTSVATWQATLFTEVRTTLPVEQLWVGRFNFAIVALAVYFVYRFVQVIAAESGSVRSRWHGWLIAETVVAFVVTMFTPLVDADERVTTERAITVYGHLYALYLLHVVSYLVGAVRLAVQASRRSSNVSIKSQFAVVGYGIAATGLVALTTNGLLPFLAGEYRFCDMGGISVLLFLIAVARATFAYGLFDTRHIVRDTMVSGILLSFVLGAYSSAVFVVSQYLTESVGKVTQFAVLFIAFSFDPLRRWLEEQADKLLFGDKRGTRSANRNKNERPSNLRALSLLFRWRRS